GIILTNNRWYSQTGRMVKSAKAGSAAFVKVAYDAMERPIARYVGYYTGMDPEEDDPLTLTDNLIFEQNHTEYNPASSVLWTGSYARYHNASSMATGALVPGTTARPGYTAYYYDGIGRGVAVVQYGNQDDDSEPLDRPEATPVATDSTEEVLISQTV